MTPKKKTGSVIAVCIQEPFEDGSKMDFGLIKGDDLRFLHQAFITDTLTAALKVKDTDVRMYHIDNPERKRFVKIILDYLKKKSSETLQKAIKERFKSCEHDNNRWGIRIEEVFQDCFKAGYSRVLVVGSRTPTQSSAMLKTALERLEDSDAVFGPTPEGRYYSIGMSGEYRVHLSDFDWKSPSIYSEVTEAFNKQDLAWAELEIWYAVEHSDDLEIMVRDINQFRFEGDEQTSIETEKVMERILSKMEL